MLVPLDFHRSPYSQIHWASILSVLARYPLLLAKARTRLALARWLGNPALRTVNIQSGLNVDRAQGWVPYPSRQCQARSSLCQEQGVSRQNRQARPPVDLGIRGAMKVQGDEHLLSAEQAL